MRMIDLELGAEPGLPNVEGLGHRAIAKAKELRGNFLARGKGEANPPVEIVGRGEGHAAGQDNFGVPLDEVIFGASDAGDLTHRRRGWRQDRRRRVKSGPVDCIRLSRGLRLGDRAGNLDVSRPVSTPVRVDGDAIVSGGGDRHSWSQCPIATRPDQQQRHANRHLHREHLRRPCPLPIHRPRPKSKPLQPRQDLPAAERRKGPSNRRHQNW